MFWHWNIGAVVVATVMHPTQKQQKKKIKLKMQFKRLAFPFLIHTRLFL